MARFKPPQRAKRDANEDLIVDALEAHGFVVERTDKPTDLLISKRGLTFPAEVKNPAGRNRIEAAQERFLEKWPAPVPIFRTVEDVAKFNAWVCGETQTSILEVRGVAI